METINADMYACYPTCIDLCGLLCQANGSDSYWTNDNIVWWHDFVA